jgi:EAL and modified HD-GYP domain-containing signal transduction protein
MATRDQCASGSVAGQLESAGELRYFARQPILHIDGRVHGYELLFRQAPEAVFRGESGEAVETMLDNAVIFGLEALTNGLPAFVTCTEEALIEQLVLVLTPNLTVLCFPARHAPSDRLMDAIRTLKARGYRFALDDFVWNDRLRPLAEQADYVRLDFTRFDRAEQEQLYRLRGGSTILAAQKVETPKDYLEAGAKGFTLFQGSYFCRPLLLKRRKAPANCMLHFEIVRELYHHPIDLAKVSELVRRDASLTYRLLRLVNSPVYAIQQEIRRIESAILALGEETFRRVVSLAVISELNTDQPVEILRMALQRARFCELAAGQCDRDPSEQYLLGMLSLLPAMLGLPMEEIAPTLPLRGAICEALAGASNPERCLLGWLEFHERGDWAACDRITVAHRLDRWELARRYESAVLWSEVSLRSAVA